MVQLPMKISHNRPLVLAEDRAAVDAALSSGWLAAGPEVAGLEAEFIDYFGRGRACAVSSGTAALYIALRALGVSATDNVAIPTYACSALLNAIQMSGAKPIPVDVRRDNYTLEPNALEQKHAETPFSAIIAVHTYGAAANMTTICSLGPPVIEDCCQSLGSAPAGQPLGLAGAAAVFSFYATKVITSGHGGLLFDKEGVIAAKAHDYRAFDGRENYAPRFNFHLSDIQAALVRQQFQRLATIRQRRNWIAEKYHTALSEGYGMQAGMLDRNMMVYRFIVEAPSAETRDRLRHKLLEQGIETIVPLERFELLHRYLNLDPLDFPNAEMIVDRTLSLPIHLSLSDEDVARVGAALENATQY